MPPTPTQVDAFVNDKSDNAHESVVDQLLESKHFGERWARHWMDMARYAESCGHEFDYPIPHAYEYRDYLIRALNEDVPYDQFITEHLAGDLLKNPRLHPTERFNESLVGTGFWFFSESTHAPVDVKGNEAGIIDNRIDVMSRWFLGMTVACARCHDHKFDAISTEDYYAMSGFLQKFTSSARATGSGKSDQANVDKLKSIKDSGDQLIAQAAEKVRAMPVSEITRYLKVATKYVVANPSDVLPEKIVIEGEAMKVKKITDGQHFVQDMGARGKYAWSNNKQFWWITAKPESTLELTFEIAADSTYNIEADLTKAIDYGIAEFEIDGKSVSKPIDFFNDGVIKETYKFETTKLKKGKHVLTVRITGSNPKAVPKHMIGIDLLRFDPAGPQVKQAKSPLVKLAMQNKLKHEILQPLISALRDPEIKELSHPLNVWYELTMRSGKFDERRLDHLRSVAKRDADYQQAIRDQNSLPIEVGKFSSVNNESGFGDWFETGFAFDGRPTSALQWDSHRATKDGKLNVISQSSAHSGLLGTQTCWCVKITYIRTAVECDFVSSSRRAGQDPRHY